MPIVKRPNFMDIEIPFDEDTIVKLQREGYEVRPDRAASDKRKEIENDLIAEKQRKVWKNNLLHTPKTAKEYPAPVPGSPAVPDNPEVSEQLIKQWKFPYPGDWSVPVGIRQVTPNPTVDFHNNQAVDPKHLLNRKLWPEIYNRDLRVQAAPVPNIKLSAIPAPAPITLNDLAAAMLVNRTNPLST